MFFFIFFIFLNFKPGDSEEISIGQCISDPVTVPGSTQFFRKIRLTNSAEPPTFRAASANTAQAPICRPKNAKKGPFDFVSISLNFHLRIFFIRSNYV